MLLDFVAVGDEFEARLAQSAEDALPKMAFGRHAPAESQGERQLSAFGNNFTRQRRQRFDRHTRGIGEQRQSLGFAGQLHLIAGACHGAHQPRVARGQKKFAAWAEHIERIGIRALPDIVEDQQSRTFREQVLQLQFASE
jgi:hypothetical protein